MAASHHDATLKRGPVVHHVRGLNCIESLWKNKLGAREIGHNLN